MPRIQTRNERTSSVIRVDIDIPDLYQEPLGRPYSVCVHTAALNARATESFLAHAIMECARYGRRVQIAMPKDSPAAYTLRRWLNEVEAALPHKLKHRVEGKHTLYDFGGGLWVTQGVEIADPPIIPDVLYAVEHQDIGRLTTGCRLVRTTGTLPRYAGHWTEDIDADVITIDADAVCKRWSDQRDRRISEEHVDYDRLMRVKRVNPMEKPLLWFARRYAKITTDKRLDDLTEFQRERARGIGTPVMTVPFDFAPLNRYYEGQKRLARMKGKKPWYLVLKFRRGGITTHEQMSSYRLVKNVANSQVITMADVQEKTQRIFRMVSRFQSLDPSPIPTVGDSKTALELANGSIFFVGTAGASAPARGDTLQKAHWSEAAHSCKGPNQNADTDAIKASLMAAASFGELVFETTPLSFNWFHSDWVAAKDGASPFTPILLCWFHDGRNRIPCDAEAIRDTLTDEERSLIERHKLDFEQIAWRRERILEHRTLFPQEYPENDVDCFLHSGQSWFDRNVVIERLHELDDEVPAYTKQWPGGVEYRWKSPQPGRTYVAGCDTSEGKGPPCDMNGVGILDRETKEQVASIHGRFTPEKLGMHAARMCSYYNNALLGVERNNHGHAVLLALKNQGYDWPHTQNGSLYYHKGTQAGWPTNVATRDLLLDTVAQHVDGKEMIVHDKQFLHECMTFGWYNDRWDHAPGEHDDSIFKWAIALEMCRHVRGKPLMEFVELQTV